MADSDKNLKKINLNEIKSKYIIKKIFDNIEKNKFLIIIKYNKNIQSRLDLDINIYKENSLINYFEIKILKKKFLFESLINLNDFFFRKSDSDLELNDSDEWEYSSNDSKEKPENYSFINLKEKFKPYFHFYFDIDKIEEKANCMGNKLLSEISVFINDKVDTFDSLFEDCEIIKKIKFLKVKRNNIKKMNSLFQSIFSEEEKIYKFCTKNIINMSNMFNGCIRLQELDLSNIDTINVTNMSNIFKGCIKLTKLNLSNFNTINVTDMSNMFSGCVFLRELNISNFNTKNVINMSSMFSGCKNLKELNLSNFDTSNVTNMSSMFKECCNLK